MATSKKKQTAQAPAAPAVLNMALLGAVVVATSNPAQPYLFVLPADAAPLADAGLIEQNPLIADQSGALATRATQKGIEEMSKTHAAAVSEPQAAPATAPAAPLVRSNFVIASVPLPDTKRSGRKSNTYPFDELAVGQAFFVPASADMPNPHKSLASTVAGAMNRHAVPTGTQRVNRKGKTVDDMKRTRIFELRKVEDGAIFGEQYKGTTGAGVWRTA